jgi:hypothetical protein
MSTNIQKRHHELKILFIEHHLVFSEQSRDDAVVRTRFSICLQISILKIRLFLAYRVALYGSPEIGMATMPDQYH